MEKKKIKSQKRKLVQVVTYLDPKIKASLMALAMEENMSLYSFVQSILNNVAHEHGSHFIKSLEDLDDLLK